MSKKRWLDNIRKGMEEYKVTDDMAENKMPEDMEDNYSVWHLMTRGMFLYSAVSSPLDGSKRFTLHPLVDLFIPTPTGLL